MNALEFRLAVERRSTGGERFTLDVELRVDAGITVVQGRSGSGKSTLLMALLGALRPRRGRIVLRGETLFDSGRSIDVPLRRRGIGIVFQDALLFPHMTARGNVAFAARRSSVRHAADGWLERVGAAELAGRLPHELSGGQRQRVALARALAAEPRALLLDEPFSALDLAARSRMSGLLLELQGDGSVPFLHVTHDLGEALRIGRRLALLDAGRIVQCGPPADVVASPAGPAAESAVGTGNLLPGTVAAEHVDQGYSEIDVGGTSIFTLPLGVAPGQAVVLGLRSTDVLLSAEPTGRTSARNVLPGTVERITPRAGAVEVRVAIPTPVRATVTPEAVQQLRLRPGATTHLLIKASAFHRLA